MAMKKKPAKKAAKKTARKVAKASGASDHIVAYGASLKAVGEALMQPTKTSMVKLAKMAHDAGLKVTFTITDANGAPMGAIVNEAREPFEGVTPVSLYLDEDVVEYLDMVAHRSGQTREAVVNIALAQHVIVEEAKRLDREHPGTAEPGTEPGPGYVAG
jgi:ABC-type Zn uptake system ZnuABC Zn-binding protein ZnuA